MLARVPDRMSVEEFVEWEQHQLEKHELIDGRPVLRAIRKGWVGPTAMAGSASIHNHIAMNIALALKQRLKGGPCKPLGSDQAVKTPAGKTRYPDVVVECGPLGRNVIAREPRVVFEVLSPSNTAADQFDLLNDYQSVPSVMQIVYVEQNMASVVTWTRHEVGWHRRTLQNLDQSLALPVFGFELPFEEIYEGVEFEQAEPQLVS